MEIEKAIENLSDSAYRGVMTFNQEHRDAEKLGIEALIFAKNVIKLMPVVFSLPQPDETDK